MLTNTDIGQARWKRCDMAAVAAPKICLERGEKKGREGRKEREKRGRKERGEKRKTWGEESKRERCIRLMGVKKELVMLLY